MLQRRSGPEHVALIGRIVPHAVGNFSFSIVSFHEQVLGAHTFLSRAQTPRDVIRGYHLLGFDRRMMFAGLQAAKCSRLERLFPKPNPDALP